MKCSGCQARSYRTGQTDSLIIRAWSAHPIADTRRNPFPVAAVVRRKKILRTKTDPGTITAQG
jgi:hypothetical protein